MRLNWELNMPFQDKFLHNKRDTMIDLKNHMILRNKTQGHT